MDDLPQSSIPSANVTMTVCLACDATSQNCHCIPEERHAAMTLLHQELVAMRTGAEAQEEAARRASKAARDSQTGWHGSASSPRSSSRR